MLAHQCIALHGRPLRAIAAASQHLDRVRTEAQGVEHLLLRLHRVDIQRNHQRRLPQRRRLSGFLRALALPAQLGEEGVHRLLRAARVARGEVVQLAGILRDVEERALRHRELDAADPVARAGR